ncbi:hypothetical protein Q7P35_003405 [Cladosporium inversicolor]
MIALNDLPRLPSLPAYAKGRLACPAPTLPYCAFLSAERGGVARTTHATPPAPPRSTANYEYQPSLQTRPNPPSPAAIPSSPPPPPSSSPPSARALFASHTLVCFCPPVIIPPLRPGPSLLHFQYLPWTLRLTERDAAACILPLSSSPHTAAARHYPRGH